MFKKLAVLLLGTGMIFSSVYCDDDEDDIDEDDTIKIEQEVEIPYDQRLGGSGVFELGLTRINLHAVEKIVTDEIDKGGFDFHENVFTTLGVIGYAGQRRNGMRIGCGLWGGYNSLFSDKWTTRASQNAILNGRDTLIDSIIKLHLIFGHAGLVVEKSFKVGNNLNLYAGGMLGGGILMAIEDRRLGSGAFYNSDNDNYDDWDSDTVEIDNRVALAPVWAFDIRAGFTYSFTKWLHVGLDGSSLFYYSQSGFQSKFGSFWSVNPGVKLRFVFGTSA